MQTAISQPLSERVQFNWMLSPKKDLVFYIGSALGGWLYVGIIFYAIYALNDPLRDALLTLHLGGIEIPLNLELLAKRRSELWILLKDDIGVVRKGGQRQVVTRSDVQVVNVGDGQSQLENQLGQRSCCCWSI